jgi:16S rRNA (guanine966-N2)-methyltransferase
MSRIIAGQDKGRRLRAPRGDLTRPTGARVRQSLFDMLAPRIPGCRFLDLCAGSGAVGLEALSRGAGRVVLVDSHREALAAIRANLASLGAIQQMAQVHRQDVRAAVAGLDAAGERFDIVFLDPPYDGDLYEPVLAHLGQGSLLAPQGLVVAEHFHKRALPETIGRLHQVRSVRIGDHRLSFFECPQGPPGLGDGPKAAGSEAGRNG